MRLIGRSAEGILSGVRYKRIQINAILRWNPATGHIVQNCPSRDAEMSSPSTSQPKRGNLLLRATVILIVLGLVAGGATIYTRAASTDVAGPKLTHKISRDDLLVTVTEQGTLESSSNTEIKCKVRGGSTVLSVIETGTAVKPGDELIRLDTATIEDNINQQKIVYQTALATHTQSEADVAVAKISITEYMEGTFRSEMQTLEKNLAIAQSNLRTSANMLEHAQRMFKKGYTSQLEVESNEFSVKQSELELDLVKTQIDVLERFTKSKQMEGFESALKAKQAKLESDKASLDLAKDRLTRAEEQLQYCVIKAETSGMVIYPSAAEWKETPDVEEGAAVREDQVLLLIPDMTKMQVKVGIHESRVDELRTDMPARVTLMDAVIDGKVASIATVTKPAGWWTGNVVKYDTIISLNSTDGIKLKPGMTVEVEVIVAEHKNVPTIPVAAVLEHEKQFYCWVKTPTGTARRQLKLGDSNDQFIVVKDGVAEGEDVILNPRALVDEAQMDALKPLNSDSKADDEKAAETNEKKADKKAADSPGAQILKLADKNKDGVLTIDEYEEKDRQYFEPSDANKDGKVDVKELDAAIKKLTNAAEK